MGDFPHIASFFLQVFFFLPDKIALSLSFFGEDMIISSPKHIPRVSESIAQSVEDFFEEFIVVFPLCENIP